MTTTGGDDINLAPENDHDDATVGGDNVDLDGHYDSTGKPRPRLTFPPHQVEATGPQTSISEWSKTRFRNSLVPKARTPFLPWISSDDLGSGQK
jgi:hypothetical protein